MIENDVKKSNFSEKPQKKVLNGSSDSSVNQTISEHLAMLLIKWSSNAMPTTHLCRPHSESISIQR